MVKVQSALERMPVSSPELVRLLEISNDGKCSSQFHLDSGRAGSSKTFGSATSDLARIIRLEGDVYMIELGAIMTGDPQSAHVRIQLLNEKSQHTRGYIGDGTSGIYLLSSKIEISQPEESGKVLPVAQY